MLLLADVLRITTWPAANQKHIPGPDTCTIAWSTEQSLVPISAIARALSSLLLHHNSRQLGAETIDVLCTVVSDTFALHAQHDADFSAVAPAAKNIINVVSNLRRVRTAASADVLCGLVSTVVDIVPLSVQSSEADRVVLGPNHRAVEPLCVTPHDQSSTAADCCVEDWVAAVIGCCSAMQAVLVTCDSSRCQGIAMEKLRRALPVLLSHPRASVRSFFGFCFVRPNLTTSAFGTEALVLEREGK